MEKKKKKKKRQIDYDILDILSLELDLLRDSFKTQPPVDRWFRPVPIFKNKSNCQELDGTGG